MRRIIIFGIAIFLCFFVFTVEGVAGAKDKTSDDEIIQIKKEIRELKKILVRMKDVLTGEQQKEFEKLIHDLELQLEKKEKKERVSQTSRNANKLKYEIERVKKKLEEMSGGIQFSGFFDVTASGYKNNPNIFALGDFELDIEKSFGKNFQVGAALVFNDDGAELAVGFIDFHLFGGPISARGRLFTEKGLHFQVGRFDVPFGNDWQYFASVDRVTISAPLTTEFVMDGGYNDVGIRILRAAITYNYTLFMLRGVEEGFSVGGRFGFTPFNNPFTFRKQQIQLLELGVSYLHDFDRSGNREEKAFALDLESRIGPFHLRAEYLKRFDDLTENRLEGYHLTSGFDFSLFETLPVTLFGRYDYFKTRGYDSILEYPLSRFSVGVNFNLFDISVLKLEYSHYLKEDDLYYGSSYFAQLVITF